jgi:hypothetical protein
MSKELEALERILHKIPASQQGQDELIIIQALTPPNKEELQAEIIKELNESVGRNDVKIYNMEHSIIIAYQLGSHPSGRQSLVYYHKATKLLNIKDIPLSLASKIIKFFELGDE